MPAPTSPDGRGPKSLADDSRSLRRSVEKRQGAGTGAREFNFEDLFAERHEEGTPSFSVGAGRNPSSSGFALALGQETFTPPTTRGAALLLEITGVYEFPAWDGGTGRKVAQADALYAADDNGAFLRRYSEPREETSEPLSPFERRRVEEYYNYAGLYFDGHPAPQPVGSDRELHRYTFAVTGTGEKIALYLVHPGLRGAPGPGGRGELRVRLLPGDELQASSPQLPSHLEQKVRALIARYEHHSLYEDSAHIEQFARRHEASLLARRTEILDAWQALHEDPALVAALKASSPATYERMRFEPRALALAEGFPAAEDAESKRASRVAEFTAALEEYRAHAEAAQGFLDRLEGWLETIPEEGLRDDIRAEAIERARRMMKGLAERESYAPRKKSL